MPVSVPFPDPTSARGDRREVLLDYLDYFRSVVRARAGSLFDDQLTASLVASGWTPLELVKHLVNVERRWLVWRFAGLEVDDPWSDSRDGRWFVAPQESLEGLLAALTAGGERTRAIVMEHVLTDVGAPGERWDGADPASLERVLLHVTQEFARHVGHLDIVCELLGGPTGE